MAVQNEMLKRLMRETGAFTHVLEADEYVFVANEVRHLTAACSPSLRRLPSFVRLNYDLVLMVIEDVDLPAKSIEEGLKRRRYVALPRTIPVEHSLDMVVRDGRISNWAAASMARDMQEYTHDCQTALSLIREDESKLLRSFRRVYQQKFEDNIVKPLEAML